MLKFSICYHQNSEMKYVYTCDSEQECKEVFDELQSYSDPNIYFMYSNPLSLGSIFEQKLNEYKMNKDKEFERVKKTLFNSFTDSFMERIVENGSGIMMITTSHKDLDRAIIEFLSENELEKLINYIYKGAATPRGSNSSAYEITFVLAKGCQ